MIDPVLFYVASFALAALALLLIAVIALYLRIGKKYIDLKGKTEGTKSDLVREHDAVVADAQKKAIKILDEARSQAQKIITGAELFSSNQGSFIREEMEKATALYSTEYAKTLNQIKEESEKIIQNISNDVRTSSKDSFSSLDKQILSQINNFQVGIGQLLTKFQESLKNLSKEEQLRISSEFEEVKKEKIKNLDSKIIEAVEAVSKSFLENGLSSKDHEDLIMKSLEKAKEEGILS